MLDLETINQINKEITIHINEIKNLRKSKQAIILPEFQDIFVKYPQISSFGWEQYTPYFNDGNTCSFGVNTYYESIIINGKHTYDLPEEYYEISREISILLEYLDTEDFLEIWGDHARITVTLEGITVDGCYHD